MPLLQLCLGCWGFTHFLAFVCVLNAKFAPFENVKRMEKMQFSASMCHYSLHHRDRALQVLLPWSRESSPKPGSLLIEVTTKVMKLTESIKKKVKKKRGGPIRGPEDTRSPSEKLWKKKPLQEIKK